MEETRRRLRASATTDRSDENLWKSDSQGALSNQHSHALDTELLPIFLSAFMFVGSPSLDGRLGTELTGGEGAPQISLQCSALFGILL